MTSERDGEQRDGWSEPEDGARAPSNDDTESRTDEAGSSSDAASLEAECEALRDRYLRLAAEYENYRKRTDRERSELQDRAQAQLVKRILDPLDDLQRVAHFATETATVDSLLEGVQLVERNLLRALEAAGLEMVEAQGQAFDPAHHEALMTSPTEHEHEDESVGDVFQKGYRFRGELLRPARVTVRKFGA
jgi:molecular chaperone GrpE